MSKPGLELLFSSLSSQFKVPSDTIICVLHWEIIHKGFKCIGLGDESGPNDKRTEALPAGWNSSPDCYCLRYSKDVNNPKGSTILVKVLMIDGTLHVHVTRLSDEKTASGQISISEHAGREFTNFERAYPDLEGLSGVFESLINEVTSAKASYSERSSHHTGSSSRQQQIPLPRSPSPLVDPLRLPQRGGSLPWRSPFQDPFSVGHSDLDPLGGSGFLGPGAGMFMDPSRFVPAASSHPRIFPPGAVPPGARYDPTGPANIPPVPNPDHERPPDYDDMFM